MSRVINDGGPAFPMQEAQAIHAKAIAAVQDITDTDERDRAYTLARAAAVAGMTLRDYFAAKAMHATLRDRALLNGLPSDPLKGQFLVIAKVAYMQADAMLAARGAV